VSVRRMSLVIVAFLATSVIPAGAQLRLGDVVSEYGYDGIIGKWVATGDGGRKYEIEYKWALDKHVIIVDVKIGGFKYHGMIMFVPSRLEVVQIGADNMGRTWKGTWDESYEGPVNRSECLNSDGTTEKMEHVYVKIDSNNFRVKDYAVGADGYRLSQPRSELIFKRRRVGQPQLIDKPGKTQKPKKDD